jgi:NAD(P)-dependent dehydrogenase (short-subunit alcohol dehydrogenase family)
VSSRPVAIVTGAGSGIGRAIVQRLAGEDYRIALVGRRKDRLAETAASIRDVAVRAPALLEVPGDVGDPEQVRELVKQTVERFSRVDVLVNNAAVCESHPVGATDEALLERTFASNFFGPALLVARLWPLFLRQHGGCVINVSSVATVDPLPGLGVYAATKAALESLTRSVAGEGQAHGVRAFSLVLGAVETEMLRSVLSAEQFPPDRTLDPSDVAEIVLECAAGKHDARSGQTIEIPNP